MTAITYSRGRDKFDAHPEQRTAPTFDDFEAAVLTDRAPAKGKNYVSAPFKINGDGRAHRCKEGTLPRAWLPFDLDGVRDAASWVDICLWLQRYRGFAYTTASHTPKAPRARFVLSASRPIDRTEGQRVCLAIETEIKAALGADVAKFDGTVYRGEQPCYSPPLVAQTFTFSGAPVDVDAVLATAPPIRDESSANERAQTIATDDPILRHLSDNGMVKRELAAGRYAVECPCADEHTSESNETSTVYMLPNFGGVKYGKFHCLHDHCAEREQAAFIEALGLDAKRVWAAQANAGQASGADFVPDDTETPGSDDDAPTGLHSRLVSLANLGDSIPAPHFVERILPADEVTLLGGHGGLGKSYLALLLGMHIAAGRMFGPLAVQQARVLFYSAEDGAGTLRYRVNRLCGALAIDPERLESRLHLLDMSDADAALHREQVRYLAGEKRISLTTDTLDDLATLVQELAPGVVIIDGASDTYDDDEISRARVRAFVRSLRQRIARPGRAVLLLAHVNKTTAKAGADVTAEAYSGSTAWHNSVRSRLALTGEPGGVLTLTHQKANHAAKAEPILIEFRDGVPTIVGQGPHPAAEFLARQQRDQDERDKSALLELIRQFEARGERVTTSPTGSTNVYRLLASESGFPPQTGSGRLLRLLRELQDDGRLFRVIVRTPDRKHREVFQTAPGEPESAPMPESDAAANDPATPAEAA